jgi:(S)-ureidoglycine aminohydrolase
MELFGQTRTIVAARHALIAPDGHVPSQFPGWIDATAFVMISPAMGAKLSQLLITFKAAVNQAPFAADAHEHALYIETGSCRVTLPDRTLDLPTTSFLYVPPNTAFTLHGSLDARLTVFRKVYQAHPDLAPPPITHGLASEVPGEPFLGYDNARLQTLLPLDPAFDLAINIFTYQPGATLPFVETHIMEHGLLMLKGQGVYRLEDAHYPVKAGDVIWMAPYCPQWFVAMGAEPASYLYYKDIHRLP